MKFSPHFGLVMALTLGVVLMSAPTAQCFTLFGFDFSAFFSFASKPTSTDDVGALSPGLAPTLAPAPAPGPGSALTRNSRRSGPFSSSSTTSTSGLVVGFYNDKCSSDVEAIIEALVADEFDLDPTILPALLRLQFHDCFVKGCDSSLLIDGPTSEKTADSNFSVRGYELIDKLKAALEEVCPGVVSCSDIVAIATKVVIKLGGGLDFPVETGRRDGLVSDAADVDLPSPSMTVSQGAAVFAAQGFNIEEMVVLLGYHAVGIAHCGFIEDRLTPGNSQFDSEMDPSLRAELTQLCPVGVPNNNFTPLNQDPTNNNTLDNTFYGQLIQKRGVLSLDQLLSSDSATAGIVAALAQNRTLFDIRSAQVMIKLQAVDVLTGTDGEIRKECSKFNN